MSDLMIVEINDPWLKEEFSRGHRIFTTLEGENPGGSIKDHMVRGELETWISAGRFLHAADPCVCELSAGSTAISLAHHCNELGIACRIFLPDTVSPDIKSTILFLGAEVRLVNPESAYQQYAKETADPRFFRFNQLFDAAKVRHYHGLGRKIRRELPDLELLVGAVGTGHSLMGIAAGIGPGTLVATAEPGLDWKVSGCRNLELERYGDNDVCSPELFRNRIIVQEVIELFPGHIVGTDRGPVQVTMSFQLVLAAVKQMLQADQGAGGGKRVFAVGAANKRKAAARLQNWAA